MRAVLLAPARSLPAGALPLGLGLGLLAVLWSGAAPGAALPGVGPDSFSAHMIRHMGIVAVASPLVAFGLSRLYPALVGLVPPGFALVASFAEFAVVWGWHAPALHDAARASTGLFLVEQGSFLLAGLGLWIGAFGTAHAEGRAARAGGVLALLLTSMHMTLLGALLLLGPRPLYAFGDLCRPGAAMTPLGDQALGGVIMLLVGGAAYLAGGLTLLRPLLGGGRDAERGPRHAPAPDLRSSLP
ncbi:MULTISPECIES: cytochrome c oxidase assembly protein [unclassified Aureimonas]|uniref:cytochrome c oxidase assembly protein n=1 Tax=unclassified Aureimonas TaxID=2615206 RepID=UPI000B022B6C|nr:MULTISPECIES: cytochrome c oxidase assembly protein [unclassified Aureimonas]